jgi:hypothetical protein
VEKNFLTCVSHLPNAKQKLICCLMLSTTFLAINGCGGSTSQTETDAAIAVSMGSPNKASVFSKQQQAASADESTADGIKAALAASIGATYTLRSGCSDKVLDVSGALATDEATIQLWGAHGGGNQQWRLQDAGSGYLTLIAQHSGKALDVKYSGTTMGTPVWQYQPNGTAAQQWRVVDVGGGEVKLVPRLASNMALDVSGASSANGAPVQIWSDNGSCAQRWRLEPVAGTGAVSRVDTIAAMLPAQPRGLGPACSDRAFWGSADIARRAGNVVLPKAEPLVTAAFPAWSDEAYLEFSRNGQRAAGEAMMSARFEWVYHLVLAECVEYRGRFLPALTRALNALIDQPTWTVPAHDPRLENFYRSRYEVDLAAASFANTLSQTLHLLGDRIDGNTRSRILAALDQRVFNPVLASLAGGTGNTWLSKQDNWNSVCLKGVVSAALGVISDRNRRAQFAEAAERHIPNYLASFDEDGYTAEGPAYWNYGFSRLAYLREALAVATQGGLDLFANPKIYDMARYGAAMQMLPSVIPAFGDVNYREQSDPRVLSYVERSLRLGTGANYEWPPSSPSIYSAQLVDAVLTVTGQAAPLPTAAPPAKVELGLRSLFNTAGVLVSRPDAAHSGALGFAIKAGGNGNRAISHSHNDVGSYSIALGTEKPTGDPGSAPYSANTWSSKRFDFAVYNSYGHPVPMVAGRLQRNATEARPRVLATRFGNDRDEIEIDLSSAYEVPELRSLVRTARHLRAGGSRIEIEDRFTFASPQSFEVPLIAVGGYQINSDGTVDLWEGLRDSSRRVRARVEASSSYELIGQRIDEENYPFYRIAIRFKQPQAEGQVRVIFSAL